MINIVESIELGDGSSLLFREGRWYLRKPNETSEKEQLRSEAFALIVKHGKQRMPTTMAWTDLIQNDQALLRKLTSG